VAGEGPLVLFLGDSIAAGLDLAADDAFPAVLQRELAAVGVPFRLINAGVSGDTTAGGLRRLDWLLKQDPDWVVVELGGNDGLRGLPLASIEASLDAIVAKAQASGARVWLLGTYLPPNYGADYTAAFAALQRRVAEARGVAFVPFFLEGVGGVPEMNQSDGLHPTAEGQREIARRLAPVLRELLAE
jgi:acyl-CoA thioesterase-1